MHVFAGMSGNPATSIRSMTSGNCANSACNGKLKHADGTQFLWLSNLGYTIKREWNANCFYIKMSAGYIADNLCNHYKKPTCQVKCHP